MIGVGGKEVEAVGHCKFHDDARSVFAFSGAGDCPCWRRKCHAWRHWRDSRFGKVRMCCQSAMASAERLALRCSRAFMKKSDGCSGGSDAVALDGGHCSGGQSPNRVSRMVSDTEDMDCALVE